MGIIKEAYISETVTRHDVLPLSFLKKSAYTGSKRALRYRMEKYQETEDAETVLTESNETEVETQVQDAAAAQAESSTRADGAQQAAGTQQPIGAQQPTGTQQPGQQASYVAGRSSGSQPR